MCDLSYLPIAHINYTLVEDIIAKKKTENECRPKEETLMCVHNLVSWSFVTFLLALKDRI